MKRINIEYTLTSPVSHIGETASTGSYFQTINTAYGRVPVITGNSFRGIIRDKLAAHLLKVVGAPVDKETFNVLFSGGNISGSTKNDVERAKLIREHFPMLSLLGGGLGTMIMSGNLISGFLYPVCVETEPMTCIQSDVSWHNLIDDMEFTQMDDSKEDKNAGYITDIDEEKKAKASTQMRFSVQYLCAGTQFVQTIILPDSTSDMEEATLYAGLAEWFKIPVLGGMKAKGFGQFNAVVDEGSMSVENGVICMNDEITAKIARYNDFLAQDNASEWLYLLREGKKDGKK